jgi:hypothetical protein
MLVKVGNAVNRVLFLAPILLIVASVLMPIRVPISVSDPTRDFFRAIDGLPPDSVVVISFSGSLKSLEDQEAQFIAVWKILFQRDLKVLFYSTSPDSPIILDSHLGKKVKPEEYGKVYGEDYVRLGYTPLEEAGQASFALSIRSVYFSDHEGRQLDELPMMGDIDGHEDIDLLIYQASGRNDISWAVRQWAALFDTPLIVMTTSNMGPLVTVYYPGQIRGFVSGLQGGRELEVVGGLANAGAMISDARSLPIIALVIVVILGNITWFTGILKR